MSLLDLNIGKHVTGRHWSLTSWWCQEDVPCTHPITDKVMSHCGILVADPFDVTQERSS